MEDTVKTRRNPLAWFSKHKKLTALLLVVLIAAVLVLRAVLGGKKAAGSTYQFVRTSTLQKTSLTDSVSVNGTVKSGYEAASPWQIRPSCTRSARSRWPWAIP